MLAPGSATLSYAPVADPQRFPHAGMATRSANSQNFSTPTLRQPCRSISRNNRSLSTAHMQNSRFANGAEYSRPDMNFQRQERQCKAEYCRPDMNSQRPERQCIAECGRQDMNAQRRERPPSDCKRVAVPLLHFGTAEEATPFEAESSIAQGAHITPRSLAQETCNSRVTLASRFAIGRLERFGQEGRHAMVPQREEIPEKRPERQIQIGVPTLESACSLRPSSRLSDNLVLPLDASRSLGALPPSSPHQSNCVTAPAASHRRIPVEREEHLAPTATKGYATARSADQCSDPDSSNIRTDKSLTSEQLQAYREVEQAEMTCELKRMENMLLEERERNTNLQNTFAHELMAQRDAHSRDVKALEDVISKVLEDNRRLSNMVEGLCGQVEKSGNKWKFASQRNSLATGTPSLSSGHSRRLSIDSTSSGGGSPSSKDLMPVSSEAGTSTDTPPISSDEAA